ncbi:MAG: hypothetical protein AAFW00_13440 [Bacteroidota bacterium]
MSPNENAPTPLEVKEMLITIKQDMAHLKEKVESLERINAGLVDEIPEKISEIALRKESKSKDSWDKWNISFSIFANFTRLGVLIALIFTYLQYQQSISNEKKATATEVVKQLNSPEMLGRLSRLYYLTSHIRNLPENERTRFIEDSVYRSGFIPIRNKSFELAYNETYQNYKWKQVNDDFNALTSFYDHTARLCNLELVSTEVLAAPAKSVFIIFDEINQSWPFVAIEPILREAQTPEIDKFLATYSNL